MSPTTEPSAPRMRRRGLLPAALALAVALAGGLILWRSAPHAPPAPQVASTAGGRSVPNALPPAPDAGVPSVIRPGSPASAPAAPESAADAEDEAGNPAAPTAAYAPVPNSDNPNVSLARRAGLQRAPNPLHLTASVAVVMDAESGDVLYARNELAILPIASVTKLMTAMVLLDAHLPMSQKIRITSDDVDTLRHSRSRLRVGTELTRAHALELALMSSENRAGHALARTYPGGVPAFVAQMNRKAAALGMTGSHFAGPTGLLNDNRSTGLDVAKLLLAASKYTLVREYSTMPRHLATFGKRHIQYLNSNRLVRYADWPIDIQKTGYIVEAGHCMTMMTRVHDRPVVLVLLDAGSVKTASRDARKLRQFAERQVAEREAAATPEASTAKAKAGEPAAGATTAVATAATADAATPTATAEAQR